MRNGGGVLGVGDGVLIGRDRLSFSSFSSLFSRRLWVGGAALLVVGAER